jgi:hypothetical protein
MYRNLAIFFLNFGQVPAIENLKNHMTVAFLIYNIAFWLCITSKKQRLTTT